VVGERLTQEFSQPFRRSEPPRRVTALSAAGPTRPRLEAVAQPMPAGSIAAMTEEMAKIALIDLVLGEITRGSQVHIGFGVYHMLMGAPLVKKDLLQRGIYVERDANFILADVPDDARAVVMRQLINRGRPIAIEGMQRFLVHHGLE
jgi:hypothetical protein